MLPRMRTGTTALLAALALAACAPQPEPEPEPEPWHAPDAPGPHDVGTLMTDAPSQAGIVLPVQVWYPTVDFGGGPWSYDGIAEGGAAEWSTPDCSEVRPVVVFSHGNGGIRFQTYSVMEFLASHGWLVVAPDHVDNTAFDMVDDWPRIALRRPLDVADAFDHVVALADDPASRLTGCLDPDAGYAVMGHSFGGFTSYAVAGAAYDMELLAQECADDGNPPPSCADVDAWLVEHPGELYADHSDPRAWAAVPWAPAWYEAFGGTIDRVDVPTLVIGADRDDLTSWDGAVLPSYSQLTVTPRYLAGLLDSGHYSFTDLCGPMAAAFGENGCSDDFRDFELVLETTRTLSLALLRTLQGDTDAADWLPPDDGGVDSWEAVE
jgi:predicted dienelactone hydrolase